MALPTCASGASVPGRHLFAGGSYGPDRDRFHIYNVGKKWADFSWQNLFYAAPLGAPMAILLSGLVGFARSGYARVATGNAPDFRPAGRPRDGCGGGGRPAGHDRRGRPAALPRRVPQSLHGASGDAAAARRSHARVGRGRRPRRHQFTRGWMRILAAMGFAGVGFHAYGVSRNMGGWRNWSQNILNGPPLPAPPSFAGLALAGLAALGLMKDHPDA